MVVLESFKCAKCRKQCDRVLIDGYSYEIAFYESGSLFCGTCWRKISFLRLPHEMVIPNNLAHICSFVNSAPEEDMCLIDLQIALNVNCSKCNYQGATLYRCSIQQVLCEKCRATQRHGWETSSALEKIFRKIICELTERAMPKTRIQQGGVDGILPVQILAKCKVCKEDINACSRRPILLNGELYCYSCSKTVYEYLPVSQRCYCLSQLIDFIHCIPENQLHLLTYSKWLKAVNCTKHQDMLSELNAVSADGTRTSRKLRSFFKTEHVEKLPIPKSVPIVSKPIKSAKPVVSAQAATGHMNNLTTLMSKLDPRTPERLLPARITCSCGWEEELSNMFDCFTCSTYGVCALCLAKKHWGHEIKESINTLTLCLIDSQSKVTRQMLSTWTGHAKELSQQGEQSFEELCRVLGLVYKDAVNCDDPQRIQSLLTKANTSEIEVDFKNVMNSTRRLYKRIDGFCVDLLNAVEETENTTSTVKEAPRVDRK